MAQKGQWHCRRGGTGDIRKTNSSVKPEFFYKTTILWNVLNRANQWLVTNETYYNHLQCQTFLRNVLLNQVQNCWLRWDEQRRVFPRGLARVSDFSALPQRLPGVFFNKSYQVPGARFQVPGTRYRVPGARYQVFAKIVVHWLKVDLPREGSKTKWWRRWLTSRNGKPFGDKLSPLPICQSDFNFWSYYPNVSNQE